MTCILVVEDDLAIATNVMRGLRACGYEVELATDGVTAEQKILAGGFDLVVLDLSLPEMDGHRLLERCRSRVSTPFLVVTARTGLETRLRSFDLGAADFLAKPFFMQELAARIRARLPSPASPPRTVRFADVEVDLDSRVVRVRGQEAGLSAGEVNLLLHLIARPMRPFTREHLAAVAFPPDSQANDRTVDSYVAHIRKKLGSGGAPCVQTVFRIGYRFNPDAA
jgi:DNA-binding response OmpR family regulator